MLKFIIAIAILLNANYAFAFGQSQRVGNKGITYYVSTSGSDSNSGTQADKAWSTTSKISNRKFNAYDIVKLKGGDTFTTSTIALTNANNQLGHLTLTTYGSGQPTISSGNASECIKTTDAASLGLILNNITCTGGGNTTNSTNGISIINNRAANSKLAGPKILGNTISGYGQLAINVQGTNGTSGFTGITISNNTIHDVTGNFGATTFGAGGIMVYSITGLGSGTTTPSHTNVTITGNILSTITGTNSSSTGETGDGIVVGESSGILVSSNVVHDFGLTNGSIFEPIGIYIQDSLNGIISKNEIYNGFAGTNATPAMADGVSINNGTINILFEKNWIHDNAGFGALLGNTSVAPLWANNTFRFNLLQNNGFGKVNLSNIGVLFAANASGAGYIYNNTIVEQNGGIAIGDWTSSTSSYTLTFANNILAVNNGSTLIKFQHPSTLTIVGNDYYTYGTTVNFSWSGVAYTSFASWQTATAQEKISGSNVGLTSNPSIYVPGGGFSNAGYVPANLMAYNLQSGSPMIGAGQNLNSLYGLDIGSTDYYGITISAAALPVGSASGDFGSFVASCSQTSTFLALTSSFTKADNVNYNSWICGSQSDGDLALMDAAYLLAAPNHAAMLLDISGRGHNLTENGTVIFTPRTGAASNGTTGFEDTGWNVNSGPNYTLNSVTTAGYDLTAPHITSGSPVILGVQNTGGTSETTLVPYGATLGHSYCDANDETGTVTSTVTQSGFVMCQRTVSTTDNFYTNQGGANSRAATSVALPNANMFLLASSNYLGSGVTGGFITDTISLAFIGSGNISTKRTPLRANSFMQAYGINTY